VTKKVDVAIIGGGPAAIYAAYEFVLKYPEVKVLIIEEGHAIDFRNCPIIAGKVESCIRCTPCSIMRGFGGAGPSPTANTTSPPSSAAGSAITFPEDGHGPDRLCG
jgi:uncharacterized FAD-dependent dehydrogenase